MRSIDVNEYEGAVYVPTTSWDSGRASFVVIWLHSFSGRQSLLLGPSSYPRDCPLTTDHADASTTERERERGIPIRQTIPERGPYLHLLAIIVPRHRRLHRLITVLIPDCLAIALIKTTVHEQLFLRRRTRALELGRRESWWVGAVGRG